MHSHWIGPCWNGIRSGNRNCCSPRLANSELICQSSAHYGQGESADNSQKGSSVSTEPPVRSTSPVEKTQSDGMSIIRENLNHIGLSSSAQKVLMASWRPGTSKQYDSYLRKWSCYCKDNGINRCHPTITQAIEFLVSLYSSGLGYSAVNSARSALSAVIIMDDGSKFGEHPLVCHCLKRDLWT